MAEKIQGFRITRAKDERSKGIQNSKENRCYKGDRSSAQCNLAPQGE